MLVPAILIVAAFVAAEGTANRDRFPHVRMPQAHVARLVAGAAARSPTLASLLQQLQDTDVVVFVTTTTALAPRIAGRTILVNATSSIRYLRVEVRANASGDEIITTIAHELQHAMEIARSDVRSERALARLFETIGEHHARGFESAGARAIGVRVRRELARPMAIVADDVAPADAQEPVIQ